MISVALKQINKMDESPFSWKARGNSFGFAFEGLRAVLKTEHNTWIHAGTTAIVLLFAFYFRITKTEWLILVILISQVWFTEILNTAIEKAMDFISKERHPQIKLVKDLASAAVMVSAIAAVIGGVIIFWSYVF